MTQYLGEFEPVSSVDVGDGWIKHTFDPDGGNGPICIAGTPYSVFTRGGNPSKLLIMLQGGGACWQDFYFCNILAESQEPPTPPVGIWDFDSTIRDAFYETDGDATNRFFTNIPTQAEYRALILSEHGPLNEDFPDRYKLFIVSGDDSHTALQVPLLYSQDANGTPLNEWTDDFLVPRPFWINIVEDFVPLP